MKVTDDFPVAYFNGNLPISVVIISIAFETVEYFLKTHEMLRLAFFFWLLSHLLFVFLLNSRPKMLVQSSYSLHTFYQLHGFSYSMLIILKYFSDLQELVSSKTTAIFLCRLCLCMCMPVGSLVLTYSRRKLFFLCSTFWGIPAISPGRSLQSSSLPPSSSPPTFNNQLCLNNLSPKYPTPLSVLLGYQHLLSHHNCLSTGLVSRPTLSNTRLWGWKSPICALQ